jgi:hypothetical protein
MKHLTSHSLLLARKVARVVLQLHLISQYMATSENLGSSHPCIDVLGRSAVMPNAHLNGPEQTRVMS